MVVAAFEYHAGYLRRPLVKATTHGWARCLFDGFLPPFTLMGGQLDNYFSKEVVQLEVDIKVEGSVNASRSNHRLALSG